MKQRPTSPAPFHVSRRGLLLGSAAAAALAATGRPLAARRRGDELRVGFVGVGGMGASDLDQVASAPGVRVSALCDVDAGRLGEAARKHPSARTFADWRVLLEQLGSELDALVVSTPDHMHGPVALAAMDLGKHVYCQKPIAHNLRECRAMTEMAERRGVVTQMGTQIHSHEAYRTAVASVRAGIVGKVREAHLWVSKSWAGPAGGRPAGSDPVPEDLSWDLWLGVAPERPYKQGLYHPANWRGWRDFGSGTLGDMGCHIFDPVFSALDLGAPSSVTSHGPAAGTETFPADGDLRYEFPATAYTDGPLRLRWTDGSGPSRPDAVRAQLPEGTSLPGSGSFLVGENGVIVIPHWSTPRIFADGNELALPLKYEPGRNHYHEWVAACRGEGRASTPFSYSGPLTEAVLAGVVAQAFPGERLAWDSKGLRFDDADAQALVERSYRKGWDPFA